MKKKRRKCKQCKNGNGNRRDFHDVSVSKLPELSLIEEIF